MKIGSKVDAILGLKDFYDKIESPIDDDVTLKIIIGMYSKSSSRPRSFYRILQKNGLESKESGFINTEDRQEFEEKIYERLERRKVKTSKKAGWMSVRSCSKGFGRVDIDAAKHGFYLNIDSNGTYAVLNALVEAYDNAGLTYYFKFNDIGNKVDNIIIYTPTKNLLRILYILRQIKLDHLDLIKYFHKPSILVGKIDDNIGYGSEPKEGSYAEVRAEILKRALEEGISADNEMRLEDIRRRIKEGCLKNGIDPDKFVFDSVAVAKMKRQSQIDMIKKRKLI